MSTHPWAGEELHASHEGRFAHVWAGVVGMVCAALVPPVWVAVAVSVDRLKSEPVALLPVVVLVLALATIVGLMAGGQQIARGLHGIAWWALGSAMGLVLSLVGLGLVI
jgi:hypothetical protein